MHNQKRSEYKARFLDPKISAGLEAKALKWNKATRELQSKRSRGGPAAAASANDTPAVADAAAVDVPLALTAKLLPVNPDPSHLWNHRRELLLAKGDWDMGDELGLTTACLERNPKSYGAWFHRKWCVRRSLLPEGGGGAMGASKAEELLRRERDLCAHFLTLDERNFHCWNYRRFVVSALASALGMKGTEEDGEESEVAHERADGSWDFWIGELAQRASPSSLESTSMGAQLTRKSLPDGEVALPMKLSDDDRDALLLSEWDFTREKVESNFSNGSAFHYRSKLIPLVLESRLMGDHADGKEEEDDSGSDDLEADRFALKIDMARDELELIRSAIFTEPDDQTSWWYHRFVVAWASPPSKKSGAAKAIKNDEGEDNFDEDEQVVFAEEYLELLEEEASSLRELIEVQEGRCKWGLLGLHMILTAMLDLTADGGALSGMEEEDRTGWDGEADGCLTELAELDPDRRTRYESMRKARQ